MSKLDFDNQKPTEFKSVFTKDADAAFDEFCKKYLNSSNGFYNSYNKNSNEKSPSDKIASVEKLFYQESKKRDKIVKNNLHRNSEFWQTAIELNNKNEKKLDEPSNQTINRDVTCGHFIEKKHDQNQNNNPLYYEQFKNKKRSNRFSLAEQDLLFVNKASEIDSFIDMIVQSSKEKENSKLELSKENLNSINKTRNEQLVPKKKEQIIKDYLANKKIVSNEINQLKVDQSKNKNEEISAKEYFKSISSTLDSINQQKSHENTMFKMNYDKSSLKLDEKVPDKSEKKLDIDSILDLYFLNDKNDFKIEKNKTINREKTQKSENNVNHTKMIENRFTNDDSRIKPNHYLTYSHSSNQQNIDSKIHQRPFFTYSHSNNQNRFDLKNPKRQLIKILDENSNNKKDVSPYVVPSKVSLKVELNEDNSNDGIGLEIFACGMNKKGKLPIPKENYLIDEGDFGDDAGFFTTTSSAEAIGIADGATGNASLGYDPGDFSRNLMQLCSQNLSEKKFVYDAKTLLLKAFDDVQEKSCYGSCTACVIILDKEKSLLTAANVGDSGYCILRNGKIFHKSVPERISFACPRQLDSYPWKENSRKMGISYTNILGNDTVCEKIEVKKDDIVIISSDGLFDNLTFSEIEEILKESKSLADAVDTLVFRSVKYYRKPDDILVIIAKIVDDKKFEAVQKYTKL